MHYLFLEIGIEIYIYFFLLMGASWWDTVQPNHCSVFRFQSFLHPISYGLRDIVLTSEFCGLDRRTVIPSTGVMFGGVLLFLVGWTWGGSLTLLSYKSRAPFLSLPHSLLPSVGCSLTSNRSEHLNNLHYLCGSPRLPPFSVGVRP